MRSILIFFFSLFFFSCLSFLSSCSDNDVIQKTTFPSFQDTITVNVGFPHKTRSFEFEGKTYIYCYDLITYKKVKVYDEDFNWIKTFSVDRFSELGLHLSDIEMISPDSLVLLTDASTNSLISFNVKTGKNQKVSLNRMVSFDSVDVPLVFYPSYYSGFELGSSLFFMPCPSMTALNVKYKKTGIDGLKKFSAVNQLLPSFIKITDPFSESPELTIVDRPKEIESSLKGVYSFFQNYAHIGNKRFIYTSANRPFFYIYNYEQKKWKQIEMNSQFTNIAVENRKWDDIDKTPSILFKSLPISDIADAGRVEFIVFDNMNKLYNVFLLYDKEKRPPNDSEMDPFVWQVYDEEFNLVDEREHINCDMNFAEMFNTKKHLYLPYYNEDNYDPEKDVLLRFTF